MVLSVCICESNGGLSNFWPARFKFWGIVIEWLSGSPCVGCLRHTLGVVYTAVAVGVSKRALLVTVAMPPGRACQQIHGRC